MASRVHVLDEDLKLCYNHNLDNLLPSNICKVSKTVSTLADSISLFLNNIYIPCSLNMLYVQRGDETKQDYSLVWDHDHDLTLS